MVRRIQQWVTRREYPAGWRDSSGERHRRFLVGMLFIILGMPIAILLVSATIFWFLRHI